MKVLVADDDPISQRILTNYLGKWGYEYVPAANGAQAWELLQHDDFPVVISDWLMPEMDGLELIRRIRAWRAPPYGQIYTILLTAKSQKEDLVAAMEAGADDFLAKPFDRDELRVRLHEGIKVVEHDRVHARQAGHIIARLELARERLERALADPRGISDEALRDLQEARTALREAQLIADVFDEAIRPGPGEAWQPPSR
jgi:CheY-like chemotaxis protein